MLFCGVVYLRSPSSWKEEINRRNYMIAVKHCTSICIMVLRKTELFSPLDSTNMTGVIVSFKNFFSKASSFISFLLEFCSCEFSSSYKRRNVKSDLFNNNFRNVEKLL